MRREEEEQLLFTPADSCCRPSSSWPYAIVVLTLVFIFSFIPPFQFVIFTGTKAPATVFSLLCGVVFAAHQLSHHV